MKANYDGRQVMRDAAALENEESRVAKKYAIGTKLVQANGGPTGEVVWISGLTVTVKTAGVERKAPYQIIDQYVADGKLTIER